MPDLQMIGAGRPVRTCIGCMQSDDHPRHVIDVGDGEVTWHFDCHAAAGCESCAPVAKKAKGTGEQMLATILGHGAKQVSDVDKDEAARIGLIEKEA